MKTLLSRTKKLNQYSPNIGPIVYWMHREMRIEDNWALLYAQSIALETSQPLIIIFSLDQRPELSSDLVNPQVTLRFKQGLQKVKKDASLFNLPFYLLKGEAVKSIEQFLSDLKAGQCITDFSPLKEARLLKTNVASMISMPLIEVDAHNIVPLWVASDKQEWGAYTLRPKIHRLLETYLTPYPSVIKQGGTIAYQGPNANAWLEGNETPLLVDKVLDQFLTKRLAQYHLRNDPNQQATSGLSSYFHFGHLSTQTVALKVKALPFEHESFLEEMIVRKELADNFCYYNVAYDSFEGFPDWAKKTLDKHRNDPREYLYTIDVFKEGQTHDEAWNACQLQLVKTGYMHGYMRMYWAKKILEWTKTPEEALHIANTLNDYYQLDGRDPNGYTGTAWAIGGVHDRPWQERSVFGMIRFMNAGGLKRKFDIGAYIRQWTGAGLLE
jgi:deoxyribodipyrimidine photo-lyase